MRKLSRRMVATAVVVAFLLPVMTQGGKPSRPLTEGAALNLLLGALKRDAVYVRRISLVCVTFDTEEKAAAYFQFALRENHTAKCGGDPDSSPVVDRYRVYRASGKIEWLEAASDSWQRYDPRKIK